MTQISKYKSLADIRNDYKNVLSSFNSEISSITISHSTQVVDDFEEYFTSKNFKILSNGNLRCASYLDFSIRIQQTSNETNGTEVYRFEFPLDNRFVLKATPSQNLESITYSEYDRTDYIQSNIDAVIEQYQSKIAEMNTRLSQINNGIVWSYTLAKDDENAEIEINANSITDLLDTFFC